MLFRNLHAIVHWSRRQIDSCSHLLDRLIDHLIDIEIIVDHNDDSAETL